MGNHFSLSKEEAEEAEYRTLAQAIITQQDARPCVDLEAGFGLHNRASGGGYNPFTGVFQDGGGEERGEQSTYARKSVS